MSRNARRLSGAFAAGFVMLLAVTALADVPGPGPRPHPPQPQPQPAPQGEGVPLLIQTIPKATHSVLIIPKKFLPGDKAALDDEQPAAPGTARNVIAAIALSCGIAGMFLIRRDRKTRTIVVVLVCVGAIAMAGRLMADLAPPGGRASANGRPAHPNGPPVVVRGAGKVVIEVTDDGDTVRLLLAGNTGERTHVSAPAAGDEKGSTAPAPAAKPSEAPAPAAPPSPSP